MDRLTTSQIAEFTNPVAFSTLRSHAFGQSTRAAERSKPIATDDLEASYRVLQGAGERMEQIRGNLTTLLDLSQQGHRSGLTDRRRSELVGLMRSLAAGVDDIISQTTFDGQPLFEGNALKLGMERGRPLELEMPDLRTDKLETGALTRQVERADVAVIYDTSHLARNAASGLFGLEVTAGDLVPPEEGFEELEDGIYQGEILYEGPDSTVIVRDEDGVEVARQEGVDLSGEGEEWVSFDNGLRLFVDKMTFSDNIDKYDYEVFGPGRHQFSFGYERLNSPELASGASVGETAVHDAVSQFSNLPMRRGGESLTIGEVELTGVGQGKESLESGSYLLEVIYNGSDSSVRLTDMAGRSQGLQTGVDLSEPGAHTVALDSGLRISLENSGLTDQTGRASTVVEVERARSGVEDFDFRSFSQSVEDAIALLDEQQGILEEAMFAVEDQNMLKNAAASGLTMPRSAMMASGASGILSMGTSDGFMSPGGGPSLDAQMQAVGRQIFNHTSGAMSAQAGGDMGQGNVPLLAMLGSAPQGGGGLFG